MTMPQQLAASPPLQASQFAGFTLPTTTPIPDQLIDELLPVLSGAELKVTLYICRRTLGFQKMSDNISLRQLMDGIVKKNGERLDYGTGLSKPTLLKVLRDLEAKQIIETVRRTSIDRGDEATNYRLRFAAGVRLSLPCADQPEPKTMPLESVGWRQPDYTPRGQKTLPGGWSKNVTTPLDKKSRPQETVIQERDSQETVLGIPDQEYTNNRIATSTSTTVGVAYSPGLSTYRVEKTTQKRALKTGDDHSSVNPTSSPSSDVPPSPVVAHRQTGASALIAIGITAKVAHRMAERYSLKRIEEKLSHLDFLQAEQPEKVKNPRGWLRAAIEEDYAAPDGYKSADQLAAEEGEAKRHEGELHRIREEQHQRHAAVQECQQQEEAAWLAQLQTTYGTTQQEIDLWNQLLEEFKLSMPTATFLSYVAATVLLSLRDGKALIGLPNPIARDWVGNRLTKKIERSLSSRLGGQSVVVTFVDIAATTS